MEMMKIVSLLNETTKGNTFSDLNAVFMDPDAGVALAGHRRLYGVGDVLVRVQTNGIDMEGRRKEAGVFSYMDNQWYPNFYGLPGKLMPDGRREVVGANEAAFKFDNIYSQVNGYFNVLLSPSKVCNFIESRTQGGLNFADKKINIQVFDGVSADGQFPGEVRTLPDGTVTIALRTRDGIVPGFIQDRDSLIPTIRLREGEWYIVQRIGEVEGKHYVRVLREFRRGIRFAIQYFKSGLLLPNQARYSVLEEPRSGNNITSADTFDISFVEGQQGNFARAPYLHFDVDAFYRALKPMTMHKAVQVRFVDSIHGVLITTIPQGDLPMIDAIVGPTSPYKSGKVCTA
jgi:hypothetical protein